jgi:hypothetical protein
MTFPPKNTNPHMDHFETYHAERGRVAKMDKPLERMCDHGDQPPCIFVEKGLPMQCMHWCLCTNWWREFQSIYPHMIPGTEWSAPYSDYYVSSPHLHLPIDKGKHSLAGCLTRVQASSRCETLEQEAAFKYCYTENQRNVLRRRNFHFLMNIEKRFSKDSR